MMRFSSKLFHVIALVVCLFPIFDSINGGGVMAFHKDYVNYNVSTAKNVDQVYRTGYHFQPKQNWINDPNAPMYYKGYYHLFYQYNPKGATWGNIVWAHSVSKDMINWISLKPAIVPSKPFDKYGCWSGSATILPGNKPVILYTGIIAKKPKPGYQVQNYAIPANYSDPFLKEWIKPDDNPIVKPTHGQNVSSFRDPTTAWFNNAHWKMIIGSKHNHRGIAYLYRSRDFVKWTKAKHTFHDKPNTGMWECPDFYPVSTCGINGVQTSTLEEVKHVFKVSLDDTRFEYYTIGTYDTFNDRYYPDPTFVDGWAGLRYDYGNFYASKTFFDPAQNRRILWGWANESSTPTEDVTKGWAGIQLIPRMVWLHPNGKQLMQWPIHEVESLRGDRLLQTNVTLNKGEMLEINGITVAQADMEVTFTFSSLDGVETFEPEWSKLPSENLAMEICGIKGTKQGGLGPFGVLTLASKELEEYTAVFFRVFKTLDNKHKILMCSDATHSSLNKDVYKPSFAGFVDVDIGKNKLSLRILIDHSVVESFGEGGMTVITSRVYPTLALGRNAHLYLFNNGTETITVEKFNVWSMNSPHVMN